MCRGRWAATLAGWLLLCQAATAHHSVASHFDMSRKTTLVGTVMRVGWINPHPYVLLDVPGKSGTVQWILSTQPIATLLDAGITKALLAGMPGEKVTAVVHPALNGKPAAWVARMAYSEGRSLSLFEP